MHDNESMQSKLYQMNINLLKTPLILQVNALKHDGDKNLYIRNFSNKNEGIVILLGRTMQIPPTLERLY